MDVRRCKGNRTPLLIHLHLIPLSNLKRHVILITAEVSRIRINRCHLWLLYRLSLLKHLIRWITVVWQLVRSGYLHRRRVTFIIVSVDNIPLLLWRDSIIVELMRAVRYVGRWRWRVLELIGRAHISGVCYRLKYVLGECVNCRMTWWMGMVGC